jgi:ribonuclease HI
MKQYTDGSKSGSHVGSAAVGPDVARLSSLPKQASIFSAEIHALHLALTIIKDHSESQFVIFTDSYSSLQCIKDKYTKNAMCRRLQYEIHELLLTKTVEFCWIPSHIGLEGNEKADRKAKEASIRNPEPIAVCYTDWYPILKEKVYQKWKDDWNSGNRALKTIKESPGPWKEAHRARRVEVVINRLRCGHTNLTHNYLMNSEVVEPAPGCPLCGNATLTVKHIMLQCCQLRDVRRECISKCRRTNNPTLNDVIGENANIEEVMTFLKRIQAYDSI